MESDSKRDADGFPLEFTLDSRTACAVEAEAQRLRALKVGQPQRTVPRPVARKP